MLDPPSALSVDLHIVGRCNSTLRRERKSTKFSSPRFCRFWKNLPTVKSSNRRERTPLPVARTTPQRLKRSTASETPHRQKHGKSCS